MPPQKSGYMNDVDQLIEQTNVDQVLGYYGKQLTEKSTGEQISEKDIETVHKYF